MAREKTAGQIRKEEARRRAEPSRAEFKKAQARARKMLARQKWVEKRLKR